MKKALLASAACAALGLASAASSGAIVANVVDLGVPNDGLGGAGYGPLAGYTAFRIEMVADAGAVIQGVDFGVAGVSGKTIQAPMHQYWTLNKNAKTNTVSLVSRTDSALAGNNGTPDSYDSHFVFDPAKINVGEATNENNDVHLGVGADGQGTSPFTIYNVNSGTGTPSDGWGQGSVLSGAWGIQGAFQQQVTAVAYLVIPDSERQHDIVAAIAQVAASNGTQAVPVVIPAIPEPATLGLAVLGAGMMIRRRRA